MSGRRPSLLRGAFFHYVRLFLNGERVRREVTVALAARPDERVLDFGCGCGGLCLAVPGDYLGIDLNANYIAFARWRWGTPSRRFELVELAALDPEIHFDRAMMVSCLHHLSDDDAHAVLARLARVVRGRFVVVDLDPDTSRGLQAFLLAHDRGKFVRPIARQREILARHFTIVQERRFRTATRTAAHTLFVCERPLAAAQ